MLQLILLELHHAENRELSSNAMDKIEKKKSNGARCSYPYLMIFDKYFCQELFQRPLSADVAVGLGRRSLISDNDDRPCCPLDERCFVLMKYGKGRIAL